MLDCYVTPALIVLKLHYMKAVRSAASLSALIVMFLIDSSAAAAIRVVCRC